MALLAGVVEHLTTDSKDALLMRFTAGLSSHSELLQSALGAALPRVITAAALTDAQRRELVAGLLERVCGCRCARCRRVPTHLTRTRCTQLDESRGIAHGLAAAVAACGAAVLEELHIVSTLLVRTACKRAGRQGALADAPAARAGCGAQQGRVCGVEGARVCHLRPAVQPPERRV